MWGEIIKIQRNLCSHILIILISFYIGIVILHVNKSHIVQLLYSGLSMKYKVPIVTPHIQCNYSWKYYKKFDAIVHSVITRNLRHCGLIMPKFFVPKCKVNI